MILYFSGGSSSKSITQYMQEHNCSRLFSYYNDKKCLESKICDDVFLDCGAWTAFTKGVNIDVDIYSQYLNEHSEYYTIAASLDVIPKNNNYKESARLSYENYCKIRKKLDNPKLVIPTYHRGEDLESLLSILNYEDDFGKVDYIGIGAVASNKSRDVRDVFLDSIFYHIHKVRPDIRIHLFGLTDLSLLEKYPVYSADSTTWLIAGAMGEILTDFGRVKISDKNYSIDSYKSMSIQEKETLRDYVKQFDFEINDLLESSESRQLFNVAYMKNKVDNLKSVKVNVRSKLF